MNVAVELDVVPVGPESMKVSGSDSSESRGCRLPRCNRREQESAQEGEGNGKVETAGHGPMSPFAKTIPTRMETPVTPSSKRWLTSGRKTQVLQSA